MIPQEHRARADAAALGAMYAGARLAVRMKLGIDPGPLPESIDARLGAQRAKKSELDRLLEQPSEEPCVRAGRELPHALEILYTIGERDLVVSFVSDLAGGTGDAGALAAPRLANTKKRKGRKHGRA